jgi:dihydrofolate synthase / folylpolyglutamate synthase
MNYSQCIKWLFNQLPFYQNQGTKAYKKGLDRIEVLCEKLGNPQKELEIIHVGGTNGKGSTCHMLASILQESGYKVGLFTSPHMIDLRERIRINGKWIEKEFIINFINNNKNFFEELKPSFFELNTALGFYYFKEKKVDLAIIEVGLGGRLDSTNIIQSPFLSIITQIGYDHIDVLGDSLEQIAFEKAGIIKTDKPVLIGPCLKKLTDIFKKEADKKSAFIYFAPLLHDEKLYKSPLLGNYQKINQSIVLCAVKVLKNLGLKISNENLIKGFKNVIKNTHLVGRWQILNQKPKIIADSAHNEDGIKFVSNQLNQEKFSKLHLILGFVKEKDILKLLSFFPKEAHYYFTNLNVIRGLPIDEIKILVEKKYEHLSFHKNLKEAFKEVLKKAALEDLIFIGGSTFLVSEILEKQKKFFSDFNI